MLSSGLYYEEKEMLNEKMVLHSLIYEYMAVKADLSGECQKGGDHELEYDYL